jgi:hypothetical protein
MEKFCTPGNVPTDSSQLRGAKGRHRYRHILHRFSGTLFARYRHDLFKHRTGRALLGKRNIW